MLDLHVILDIDQTMIDSMPSSNYRWNSNTLRPPDYQENDISIWTRPYLKDFLQFLDKNVKYISIWTNGSSSWLYHVVNKIVSKYISPKRLYLLLSIDYSTPMIVNNNKVFVKEVGKILKEFPKNDVSLRNTVLVDDNYLNCIYNKYNSLPIKKYFVHDEHKNKKNDLSYTTQIINVLKNSKDVSITLKNVYDKMEDYKKLFSSPQ